MRMPAPLLWSVDVRYEQASECWKLLDASERLRSGSYVVDSARHSYIVTRAALRHVLASMMGVEPGQLRFAFGRWGKPSIADQALPIPLHFSISHSGFLSVIAVCHGSRMGVDVEQRRCVPDAAEIANSCLGDDAAARLDGMEDDVRHVAFLEMWTAAEAFAKATGLGWAGHGGRILFESTGSLGADARPAGGPTAALGLDWSIRQLDLGADHIGTLVLNPHHSYARRSGD